MDLKAAIRSIPDFPKPGILFYDITSVLEDPAAFRATLDALHAAVDGLEFDRIAALESRGFIFGAPMAQRFGKPLDILRKPGKLPGEVEAVSYDLEYGSATLEARIGSIGAGDRVLVVDDLLATGGTAAAAGELVTRLGGEVAAYLFVIELGFLGGRAGLGSAPIFSLVKYDEGG